MKKIHVNLTIDADVWGAFQAQTDERNKSSTINNLLRHYLIIQEPNNTEIEIQERLKELNQQREEILQEVTSLSVELTSIRAEKEKQQKSVLDMADMMAQSMRGHNPILDLED